MIWLFLLAGLALTAWSGMPVGIGIGLTGLAILHFLVGGAEALAVSAVCAALLFIFMGSILMASGLSRLIYHAVAPFFGRVPGQLLHTNIAVCTLFGAVSATSMATVAAVGSVAHLELYRRGYRPETVVGTLAAGGTPGLLIPPTLSLLIYGALQEVSIGRLFPAGILPGLLFALIFMAHHPGLALREPAIAPQSPVRLPLGEKLRGLLGLWPFGILVFAVLGTIYLGLPTPTEATGLGVAAAIFTGFVWGELTIAKLWQAFNTSAPSARSASSSSAP